MPLPDIYPWPILSEAGATITRVHGERQPTPAEGDPLSVRNYRISGDGRQVLLPTEPEPE